MPEGPEVQRAADRLHEALAGQRIRQFDARTKVARAWLAEHPDAFTGGTVERVWAHGKHLVGDVTSADGARLFFHSHFLMWGRWTVVAPDADEVATRDRRERARIVTDRAAALLYSAPTFTVGAGDPYDGIGALPHLGPDVLPEDGAPFDAAEFLARLDRDPDRALGAALLDQTIAAGIGNYLRAEILFACRLDPWQTVGSLSDDDRAALAEAVPFLCRRAYETGGRTVPDADQRRMADDRDLRYSPFAKPWNTGHWVFRRTNLPCLRCDDYVRQQHQVTRTFDGEDGEPVEKKRIIYFCPTCQPISGPVKPARPHKDRRPPDATWDATADDKGAERYA